jgi:hypothetical protein
VKRDFYKDTEGDKQKILAYAEELRKALGALDVSPIRLPRWRTILGEERGSRLVSFIRRRGTISTVELLSKEGLVDLQR